MDKRLRFLSVLAIIATLIAFSSAVDAGEVGQGKMPSIHPENPAIVSEADLESWRLPVEPYGVGVTPAVYLINFLIMYIANPNEAAKMPAYRSPVPFALADCLESNPTGCPYSEFAHFFDDHPFRGRANRNKNCSLPAECQTNPKWARLAPDIATHPNQINEPLGMERADRIARSIGIDKSMILTDREFQCTIGTSADRSEEQKTIVACLNALTNSKGNTNIPLSSYGLAIADPEIAPDTDPDTVPGDAQSLCAPAAPCLAFNELFVGPLEEIAVSCGWEMKLDRMLRKTPFFRLLKDGGACQELGGSKDGGACIVEPV